MKRSDSATQDFAFKALDAFQIEIPSWGFANTGTRFGKFVQAAAATSIEEKFADAAEVNRLTGVTPTVALHVLWDLPGGLKDVPDVKGLERRFSVRSGSINPNLFQDQEYKYRIAVQPIGRDSRNRRSSTCWTRSRSPRRWIRATSRSGWRTDRIIRARRASAIASAGLKKRCARRMSTWRRTSGCWWSTSRSSRRSITPILRTGAWRSTWRGLPVRRRACWWIRAITTARRTSSRLWPGCCIPICWAGSTSMTGAMPTTI